MRPRLRIGLTGGIASGKSTVAQRFIELGIPVVDADESARSIVAAGTPGLREVVKQFGTGLLTRDGELDRRALRTLIFSDAGRRRELESVLHPLIRADMEKQAAQAEGTYLVMAIPLLVEGGDRSRLQRILVVDVPADLQVQRVTARDGGSPEQARAIIMAQASRESRLAAADDVLVNSGSLRELRLAVDALHLRYVDLAAATSR